MLKTPSLFFLNQRRGCRIWLDSAEHIYDFGISPLNCGKTVLAGVSGTGDEDGQKDIL
jgi:hypothetical protein